MPGVQEKYTIDVNNRFGVADNEDEAEDEGIENVDPFEMISDLNKKAEIAKNAPKPKVQKKKVVEAKPVEAKEDQGRVEGNNRRGGNRGRGRGGRGSDRPRGPPRTQNGEEGAPQREDRPRGGGRGGRGRGGPRPDRGDRKNFDRKSGDPRTTYKGNDVKKGAGAGNWGTTEDELKAQTEPTEEKVSTEEAAAGEKKEEAATTEASAPAPPAEPEEVTMTLEEFRKSQKKSNRNPNAKLTEDKSVAAAAPKSSESRKKGRAARVQEVDLKIPSLGRRGGGDDRRGGRGGRGGGRGGPRGDRPRTENKKQDTASGYNLADDFPTLG